MNWKLKHLICEHFHSPGSFLHVKLTSHWGASLKEFLSSVVEPEKGKKVRECSVWDREEEPQVVRFYKWLSNVLSCTFVQFVPVVALFVYFHFRWWEEWACEDHPWFYRIFNGPKHQSLECRFVGLDLELPCNSLFYLKTALYNLRPSGNTWVVKLRPLSFQLYQWQSLLYIRDQTHKKWLWPKTGDRWKKGVRV